MMKQYTKLPIPIDTAWDVPRYKWQRYMHWRIKEFFTSIYSLIIWLPTIWKDRHWDDYYITKLLQKKIEFPQDRSLVIRSLTYLQEELSIFFQCKVKIKLKDFIEY